MPRRENPERLAEYDALCRFALTVSGFIDEQAAVESGASDSSAGVRRIAYAPLLQQGIDANASLSLGKRLAGIRMAVNDSLEWTRYEDAGQVSMLDAALTARGCETLTAARARIWRVVPKVMARGRIRSREEYDLVIERLNDMSSELTESERSLLGTIVGTYEAREVKKAGA